MTVADPDADAAPDGLLARGAAVEDREHDGPDRAVVVALPRERADEWSVRGNATVADWRSNADYPADALVAVVVFEDDLADYRPDYAGGDRLDTTTLDGADVDHYTFPRPRLRVVRGGGPTEALARVADTLRSKGVDVELLDGHTLRADYLGHGYAVRDDGTVSGGGPAADRLADVIREVVG